MHIKVEKVPLYLVKVLMSYRKRKSEAQGKLLVLHMMFVQKV